MDDFVVTSEDLSWLERAAMERGRKEMAEDVIGKWQFAYYAPSVVSEEGNIKPFEEWLKELHPKNFGEQYMLDLYEGGNVTFAELVEFFIPALHEFYEERVSDAESDKKSDETV